MIDCEDDAAAALACVAIKEAVGRTRIPTIFKNWSSYTASSIFALKTWVILMASKASPSEILAWWARAARSPGFAPLRMRSI